jgi:cell division protein FtsI (penicillin-binding protein 3)
MAIPGPEEHAPEADENVEELFAEVNNLPADDPLRAPQQPDTEKSTAAGSLSMTSLSPPASTALNDERSQTPSQASSVATAPAEASNAPPPVAQATPPITKPSNGSVVVDSTQRVAVPSFVGQGVRHVIEQAENSGLTVEVVGNGLAREQAPTAGTMVPAGTEVVVRFTR